MSQLDPELKRLIQWSRAAIEQRREEAPFGVAGRIVSRWQESVAPTEPAWWPRLQLATAWLSVGILITGGAFWASRLNGSTTAYDFTPAYQMIAQNIAP